MVHKFNLRFESVVFHPKFELCLAMGMGMLIIFGTELSNVNTMPIEAAIQKASNGASARRPRLYITCSVYSHMTKSCDWLGCHDDLLPIVYAAGWPVAVQCSLHPEKQASSWLGN